MGSPKSEALISALKEKAVAKVLWHIGGGTFSFLAGADVEAPVWMRKTGLQWFHRLLRNPKQMAGRYLIGNPLFVFRVLKKWVLPFNPHDSH
jgi:exopolysaccharide biosynthesis WecB/TagA/CpsF family protein